MKGVTEYLCHLIAIPSVSSLSNQPVADYICEQLDQRNVRKTNVVALTENTEGGEAERALLCHMDTVPFEADWRAAVHPVRKWDAWVLKR